MVDRQRAADTLLLLSWLHHEMLHEELAAAVEQVAQRLLSRRRIEHVVLLDPDPGQGALFLAQCIARLAERLLFSSTATRAFSHSSREMT
jgi:hypothetical protein